ncbi:DNA methyltransferase [Paenibacillus lautus]|uniref:DNA methyltransferase n=1 Tax=Paenibacillus lautus TaxID=1401 RepID=UPI003D269588
MLEIANTNENYLLACKELNLKPHPARFPYLLPEFFINYLTEPNDVVVYDPFGGSCVTVAAAEENERFWLTSEINEEYVKTSKYRFFDLKVKTNDKKEPSNTLF